MKTEQERIEELAAQMAGAMLANLLVQMGEAGWQLYDAKQAAREARATAESIVRGK